MPPPRCEVIAVEQLPVGGGVQVRRQVIVEHQANVRGQGQLQHPGDRAGTGQTVFFRSRQ